MKKLSLEEIAKEEELHVQRIEQESQPKERFVQLTFLIATEGTQTEPNYFNAPQMPTGMVANCLVGITKLNSTCNIAIKKLT